MPKLELTPSASLSKAICDYKEKGIKFMVVSLDQDQVF